MTLVRSSPIPLYYQLAELIKEQIQTSELVPAAQLSSERELSDQFEVSRMTVRQAIAYLVQQGILEVRQGVGTFVAKPKLARDMLHLLSFTEEMVGQGEQAVSQVLEQTLCRPPRSVAGDLQLAPPAQVVKVVRLRLSGETPLLLETTYIPADLCPGLEEKALAATSLYAILQQDYGLYLSRAEQSLEATSANAYESQVFGIERDAAMILVQGITYLEQGRPVEYFKAIYRGDRFKFRLSSQRAPAAEAAGQPQISMVLA